MEIKALVANSSKEARKNIVRSLKEIGVRNIVEATDRKQAEKLMQQGKIDMVFAEYTSQKAIWEEMVKAVRKIDSKLPIIMTAPQSEKIDELKQMYPTATCYLTMPFTTDQLRKTVTEYMPSLAV
jgi:two-component system chemotaxis response regulator CheY